MSFITSESRTFHRALRPDNMLGLDQYIEQFRGLRIFDHKEDPFNPPDQFSDESWIRAVMHKNNFTNIYKQARNVDIHKQWLDRSWWPSKDDMQRKLQDGTYIESNMLRPMHQHIDQMYPLLQYVCDKTSFTPDDLIIKYPNE